MSIIKLNNRSVKDASVFGSVSSLGTLTIHKLPKNHIEESFGYVLKVNTEFDKKFNAGFKDMIQ